MKKFTFCLTIFTTTLLFSNISYAYIDPSAMTYIIQLVVGIVIACGASLTFLFSKIKRKFNSNKTTTPPSTQPLETELDSEYYDDFDDKN